MGKLTALILSLAALALLAVGLYVVIGAVTVVARAVWKRLRDA